MEESDDKDKKKKKIYNLTTFPVRFAFEEIKDDIIVSTHSHSKPSQKQLINQAFKLHSQGKVLEAEKYYQYVINQGVKDDRVFLNYGSILRHLGKFKEVELSLRKALELNPNYTDAHLNLGSILRDLGNLKEAEVFTRKAIEIDPNLDKAHLNLGTILSDLGKLEEAELSTRKAIELKPDFADAHANLGSILKELGNLKEAELSTRKAIELKPDFADAHANLGSILKELGNLKDAEFYARKAIIIDPNCANAHAILGNILKDLGNLKDAEFYTRKATIIDPNFANAHCNLGNILRNIGKPKEAFDCYVKTNKLNPIDPNIYQIITRFLAESDPSQLNQLQLKEILSILLENNNVTHNELFKAFNFLYNKKIINYLKIFESDLIQEESINFFINDQIIINAMKKITFKDKRLERVLTNTRKYICNQIALNKKETSQSQLKFIITLAEQCFLNEYIYSLNEDDQISIDTIMNRCINGEINETNISILSCYFPLYKLLDQITPLKFLHSTNQSFNDLIKLQISEPLKEIELSKNIKRIGSIDDDISRKVKVQYEENPYPRWRYGNSYKEQKISITKAINNEIKPNLININLDKRPLKVLIAGCGTGSQILQSGRYQNAKVTAIDLSLSSLSYAQRKINELGIDNVELIQMDILEVNLLEEKFDVIECSGVLHHMKAPSEGLKALLGVLKTSGFLKLGLYSELARKHIVEGRNYINSNKLESNKNDIRDFRETIFSGKIPALSSLTESPDFYTLSSCRDLCFHAKEHRFTINQLQETLKSHELKFLGFLLPQAIKSLYENYFSEDKAQTNLQNWDTFEEKHPNTFIAMYQFWVCKL